MKNITAITLFTIAVLRADCFTISEFFVSQQEQWDYDGYFVPSPGSEPESMAASIWRDGEVLQIEVKSDRGALTKRMRIADEGLFFVYESSFPSPGGGEEAAAETYYSEPDGFLALPDQFELGDVFSVTTRFSGTLGEDPETSVPFTGVSNFVITVSDGGTATGYVDTVRVSFDESWSLLTVDGEAVEAEPEHYEETYWLKSGIGIVRYRFVDFDDGELSEETWAWIDEGEERTGRIVGLEMGSAPDTADVYLATVSERLYQIAWSSSLTLPEDSWQTGARFEGDGTLWMDSLPWDRESPVFARFNLVNGAPTQPDQETISEALESAGMEGEFSFETTGEGEGTWSYRVTTDVLGEVVFEGDWTWAEDPENPGTVQVQMEVETIDTGVTTLTPQELAEVLGYPVPQSIDGELVYEDDGSVSYELVVELVFGSGETTTVAVEDSSGTPAGIDADSIEQALEAAGLSGNLSTEPTGPGPGTGNFEYSVSFAVEPPVGPTFDATAVLQGVYLWIPVGFQSNEVQFALIAESIAIDAGERISGVFTPEEAAEILDQPVPYAIEGTLIYDESGEVEADLTITFIDAAGNEPEIHYSSLE